MNEKRLPPEPVKDRRLTRIESPLRLLDVDCYSYEATKDDHRLEGLKRSEAAVIIHVFNKDYCLQPPKMTADPFLMKRIGERFGKECAEPGAAAAGSSDKMQSVISRINQEVTDLPNDGNLFNLRDQLNLADKMAGIFLQLHGDHFNDGSGEIRRTKTGLLVVDRPNELLQATSDYLQRQRTLIGTNSHQQTVAFDFKTHEELRQKTAEFDVVYGIMAQPCLVVDGKVLDEATFWKRQQIGDTRHYLRLPVVRGVGTVPETLLMAQTIRKMRNNEGGQLGSAIEGGAITFEAPVGGWKNSVATMRETFASDPIYGGDETFMKTLKITDAAITMEGLKPGCYNHVVFGVNTNQQLVMMHFPGRSQLMIDGVSREVSGWDGFTLGEMLKTLNELQPQLQLQTAWSGSQGRDPGAIVRFEFQEGKLETENLTTNEGIQQQLTGGSGSPRGNTTSSRQVIGKRSI